MSQPPSPARARALRSLLLGGIFPVVIFTVVEQYFGTLWGLVAGMVFGVGEILTEWVTQKKVDTITWIGNGMLIGLGLISLFTHEGIWFKLQPALLELGMGLVLIGSVVVGRPFLVMMAEKQKMFANFPPVVVAFMTHYFRGFTVRIGLFFLIHAALATWAALYWSTEAWALLKGVGFTGTMILYMVVESLLMRRRLQQRMREMMASPPPGTAQNQGLEGGG